MTKTATTPTTGHNTSNITPDVGSAPHKVSDDTDNSAIMASTGAEEAEKMPLRTFQKYLPFRTSP